MEVFTHSSDEYKGHSQLLGQDHSSDDYQQIKYPSFVGLDIDPSIFNRKLAETYQDLLHS